MSDPALPARFGRYTLLEPIGGGGMATVYRASLGGAGGFEKELALKMVRPELALESQFVDMFLDEARISARLSHGNLVQTFDFGQVDGRWFLAMELVRGHTLAGLLRVATTRQIPLGPARSLHVIGEVARGLGFAHRLCDEEGRHLGLVHRDVSPQNVLVSREGEVKLADFGIAKAASRSTTTRTGHVRGKCSYMAPEQARGEELDARTDVFALGIVLWECLASRQLFDGPTDGAVLLQVVQREIVPPSRFDPAIPAELDDLVLRMLDRDPARRPADGDAVAQEIAALKLRLIRSPAEVDLAVFQRELSSNTAPLPQVAQGPDVPSGTASVEVEEVDPGGATAAQRPIAQAPAARPLVATVAQQQRAVAPAAPSVRSAGARRGRGAVWIVAGAAILLAAGGWWMGRGISAASAGEAAQGGPAFSAGGRGGMGLAGFGEGGSPAGVADRTQFSIAGSSPFADSDLSVRRDPGHREGPGDAARVAAGGEVTAAAGAAGDEVPIAAADRAASVDAAPAAFEADGSAGSAEGNAGLRADAEAPGEGAAAGRGDQRSHSPSAGVETAMASAAETATARHRRTSPPSRPVAPVPASAQRQREATRQVPSAAPVKKAADPGTLVLSSRLVGQVAISIDGRHLLDLQQRIPRSLEVDAGQRELEVRSGGAGLRCRVRLQVRSGGRHTLLLDEKGVSLLERAELHPLPCVTD